jgi:hypothetical protein
MLVSESATNSALFPLAMVKLVSTPITRKARSAAASKFQPVGTSDSVIHQLRRNYQAFSRII